MYVGAAAVIFGACFVLFQLPFFHGPESDAFDVFTSLFLAPRKARAVSDGGYQGERVGVERGQEVAGENQWPAKASASVDRNCPQDFYRSLP